MRERSVIDCPAGIHDVKGITAQKFYYSLQMNHRGVA
jgi:hypothetical protein